MPLRVGGDQPLGDPVRDDHQVARIDAAALQPVGERRAVDVVHHQVDVALVGAAAVGVAHHRVVADAAHLLLALHQLDVGVVGRRTRGSAP